MNKPTSGFTLIELLVAVAIIGILASLLLPTLRNARIRAKVVRAQVELNQIAVTLEMYHDDYKLYPPARTYCFPKEKREDSLSIPEELVTCGYLGSLLQDMFNPGRSYKYIAPGLGLANNATTFVVIYVPENYPSLTGDDVPYFDQDESPVKYALWSVGPSGPLEFWEYFNYPVAKRCRYDPRNGVMGSGVITRLSDGSISP